MSGFGASTFCLLLTLAINLAAQTSNQNLNKNKTIGTMETMVTKTGTDVVQGFFTSFGKGDFNGVINSFHDSCSVFAVRDSERNGDQLYGTYHGKEGVKEFLSGLGNLFDTKAFSVERVIGEGDAVFANGKFTHVLKSTGRTFSSDWALLCVIKDEKILEYHFYEDSEKFSMANR